MTAGGRVRVIVRRALLGAGGGVVLAAGAIYGPDLARELETFRVRRVEVVGTHLLDPYAVVRAAGLHRRASVFDGANRWRVGVLTLPLVDSVRTRRSLPSMVAIEVVEVQPLALVSVDASLRPVDADGHLLPLDPAGRALDLPVLAGVHARAGSLQGAGAQAALAVLGRLKAEAPELDDRVSHVQVQAGALRILFRDGGPEALLPTRPTADQLTQLRLALADLTARGELARAHRIDVRFRDQVVVSFLQSPVS